MQLKIVRDVLAVEETLGQLLIDGKFYCFTLEHPSRPKKVQGLTAIPLGDYTVQVTFSDHFSKNLPLVYNKSDLSVTALNGDKWEGIRMHGGNTELDSEGCILVASTRHINESSSWFDQAHKMIKNWIQGSMQDQLATLLKGGTHTLTISNK